MVRLLSIDVFLQDRGNKIFGALLGKQAFRFLAVLVVEVVRVLAWVSVNIVAASQQQD